ncbi:MAG: hypothetical protein KC417_04725 [Myxococcales bacterium]|nr:hypothetical protein [Myxococcales bacterium]
MATDPPPDSASVRRQSEEELVRACTAELDGGASGGRAARLHFEVAQQCETILRDAETAEKHFLAVLAIHP